MAAVIIATAQMLPRENQRAATLEILEYVRKRVSSMPGCVMAALFEASGQSKQVLYMEQWNSEQSLRSHIQSSLYRYLLDALELSAESPTISFQKVSETRSMDLIQELRAKT